MGTEHDNKGRFAPTGGAGGAAPKKDKQAKKTPKKGPDKAPMPRPERTRTRRRSPTPRGAASPDAPKKDPPIPALATAAEAVPCAEPPAFLPSAAPPGVDAKVSQLAAPPVDVRGYLRPVMFHGAAPVPLQAHPPAPPAAPPAPHPAVTLAAGARVPVRR